MADDEVFKRFKANTLKYLIKWIAKPRNSYLISQLSKYIKSDTANPPKKVTKPVQREIQSIHSLSQMHQTFMRKALNNPSNLSNTRFIHDLFDKLPKTGTAQTHTPNTPNTPPKQQSTNNNNTFAITNNNLQSAQKLIEAYTQNDSELNALLTKIACLNQKISTLNELMKSDPNMSVSLTHTLQTLDSELNKCESEHKSYGFRKQILHKILTNVQRIKKCKKEKTLQQILEKIILTKNGKKTQFGLELNALNQRHSQINKELIIICSNAQDLNISKLNELKARQTQIQTQKESQTKAITDTQTYIEGMSEILNETVFSQSINHKKWLNLHKNGNNSLFFAISNQKNKKSNKNKNNKINSAVSTNTNVSPISPNNRNATNTAINLPKQISFPPIAIAIAIAKPKKKKQKFKRPTRSKAVKAKTFKLCEVFPKRLCPIKLNQHFRSNGALRYGNQSMFAPLSQERQAWIREYNSVHLVSVARKFKALFAQNLCLPRIAMDRAIVRLPKEGNGTPLNSLTSPPPLLSKKRKLSLFDTDMPRHKRVKIDTNATECINQSSDEECIGENEKSESNNGNIVLSAPKESVTESESVKISSVKRKSKQSLNINAGKNRVFKAQNQKRHRVRTNESGQNRNGNRNKEMSDGLIETHPLYTNDPLVKHRNTISNSKNENCLHWMAKGICGFIRNGKCKYAHPSEFEAKKFICPTLKRREECLRGNQCRFSHDWKDVPCRDHCSGNGCARDVCLRSHSFSKKEFTKWNETCAKKNEAWQTWNEFRNEKFKNKRNVGNWNINDGMNAETNDERLTETNDQLFTSALTE